MVVSLIGSPSACNKHDLNMSLLLTMMNPEHGQLQDETSSISLDIWHK